MTEYRDPITGYKCTRWAEGPLRHAKLYFTCENFSLDDRYFFFMQADPKAFDGKGTCMRADLKTGEIVQATENTFGFATDRFKNIGYTVKNGSEVYGVDLETLAQTKLGELPAGGRITGHLTATKNGRIACSYHLASKIYALVILDPGREAEIVYRTDYRLGHAQICPTDDNLIFYIHETEGDAFQRTWMCDVKERYVRPYYVEHPDEWITHEVWAADGSEMAFMKLPGRVLIGDKDGRHFDIVGESEQLLHPCISRDKKWLCADRVNYFGSDVTEGVVLIERATGKAKLIATTGRCKTGADHEHPSFNRAGDMILFNNPDSDGIAQVCTIDLKQIKEDW
ncbi:MAG: hypothetical protein IKR85_03810 [Clostridia bacterium]|nr:hypothetical protein [Clostridia bacterium]